MAQLGGIVQRKEVRRDVQDQRLAAPADVRRQSHLHHRMAQRERRDAAAPVGAARDEQLLPAHIVQRLAQRRIGGGHDHAAFVQQCGRVAQRPAPGLAAGDGPHMAAVQRGFGARPGQPGQRIEPVMPILRTGGHLAGGADMHLVIGGRFQRADEAQRVGQGRAAGSRGGQQVVEIGLPRPCRPGRDEAAHRPVERVGEVVGMPAVHGSGGNGKGRHFSRKPTQAAQRRRQRRGCVPRAWPGTAVCRRG